MTGRTENFFSLSRHFKVEVSHLVMEKWVYYFKNSNLYRVRTNGTDREKISDRKISYYQIDGSKIFLKNLKKYR